MKKPDRKRLEILRKQREWGRIKRLKSRRTNLRKSYLDRFYLEADKRLIQRKKEQDQKQFSFYKFLFENSLLEETSQRKFKIPKKFNFRDNYEESINILYKIVASIYNNLGERITIDFRKCKDVSQLPLFYLKVTLLNIIEDYSRTNELLRILKVPDIRIIQSQNRDVNLQLLLTELIDNVNLDDTGLMPGFTTRFIVGKSDKIGFRFNDKGIHCNTVVSFISECVKHYDFELSAEGKNELDGMLAEILNNAEDHSPLRAYYLNANFSANYPIDRIENKDDLVGEVNITLMNYGPSIYDGLEETKHLNSNTYAKLEETAKIVFDKANYFSKSNVFTLLALQDGVSRLKFKDKSRGTGTMKFINSFFQLGGYEDQKRAYIPRFTILSGDTSVYINNKFKPIQTRKGLYIMPLNDKDDLKYPPNKANLVNLNTNFPGTMLSARVYLKREHMLNAS